MKLRLSILLLAAALAAAPASGQTIKSLGYNTTNGFVTYSGSNSLTFTNALQFSTNARAATRTNLGGTTVGNAVFTATNAAAAATAIGLGWSALTNSNAANVLLGYTTNFGGVVMPSSLTFGSNVTFSQSMFATTNGVSAGGTLFAGSGSTISFYQAEDQARWRTNLGLGLSALTNTNVTNFRADIGLGEVTSSNGVFRVSTVGTERFSVDAGGDVSVQTGQFILSGNSSAIGFSTNNTNGAATTRTNLGLGATWLTNTDVTNFRTAIGLGATNAVTFSNITANGIVNAKNATLGTATNAATAQGIQWSTLSSEHAAIYGTYDGVAKIGLSVGTSNSLSDVASFRSTGMTVASNAIVGGTLAVSNTATFATNVTVAGSLSVGSFTTTTPSTLALDAAQTAADTNGVLALPDNANVLRLTNANTISAVSNGRLGAFYFLLNQSGTNVVISNSATITARGATNITLGANQSATLISTTSTNATAH